MENQTLDVITKDCVSSLFGLFDERVERSKNAIAYQYFDQSTQSWQEISWNQALATIQHIQARLALEELSPGSCVGIMSANCPSWVFFEQAAMREGLVTVPLYPNDRPDNLAYIVNEAEIKLLLIQTDVQWQAISQAKSEITELPKLINIEAIQLDVTSWPTTKLETWVDEVAKPEQKLAVKPVNKDDLTTIVYTSGTTGRPKGVMLSHQNIFSNAYYGLQSVDVYKEDLFLSFLPLSHTLERSIGYYLPVMCGATVAFSRSIPDLPEDLLLIKPTVLISVPRIFERVYSKIQAQLQEKSPIAQKLFSLAKDVGWKSYEVEQGRGSWHPKQLLMPVLKKIVAQKVLDKLGGRVRFAISGGAPLSATVAKTFIGLGLPILQGYGLTEASPVISVNRIDNNVPESIGPALPNISVRINPEDDELQSKSDCIMLGYWKNPEATQDTMTDDGWLRTGDQAKIVDNRLFITGRIKDILVLSNGEKIPPVDIELSISLDPLIEQALVIGEGRPFLSSILVLNIDEFTNFLSSMDYSSSREAALNDDKVKNNVIQKLSGCMAQFPGYAQIRKVTLSIEPWTDENGLLTASLKIRKKVIVDKFHLEIDDMYKGH